ncbi:flagellar hook-length control protein FliK [Nitrosospira multiformis]|uniref:flagellar hook-length control protein FliK n=1 Tax=Nitrosospira multiformis TaxID=1231 RepID=UPI0002FC2992|nr:flagellar hook-length control protein FliK [Nitrosospira multiformis]
MQALLPNNEFVVMLYGREEQDGQVLQMKLPRSAHLGETFNLIFLSRAPKPTFGLVLGSQAVAPQLSETGRFISTLLQQPLPLPSVSRSMQSDVAPLLPAPPREGAPGQHTQLAQGLMQAISSSGLFYEFHLMQWVAGKRSLASLLLEPQGRLSENLPQAPAIASPPASPGGELRLSAHPHQDYLNPLHRDTQTLLRQQLDVLESGHLQWRGEIWPGQTIEWDTVREKKDDPERGRAAQSAVWKTSVHLTLPNLGSVNAVLKLGESGVEVRLAATESSAAILRAGIGHLVAGLNSAGIGLSSMGIEANEKVEPV